MRVRQSCAYSVDEQVEAELETDGGIAREEIVVGSAADDLRGIGEMGALVRRRILPFGRETVRRRYARGRSTELRRLRVRRVRATVLR